MEQNRPEKIEQEEKTESLPAQSGEIRWRFTFTISEAQYLRYNQNLLADTEKRGKRKNLIFGCLALFFGVVLLIVNFQEPDTVSPLMWGLPVFVIVAGLTSLIYYPLVFPRNLRSSVHKAYLKSRYLQHEITLELYDDHLVEIGIDRENNIAYEHMGGFLDTKDDFFFALDKTRGLILPKEAIAEEKREEFLSFLQQICEQYDKKWTEL